MVSLSNAVLIEVTEVEIMNVITLILEKLKISKTDNLRHRHPNVQFDCLLRGYIGEFAMTKWLNSFEIVFEKTNYLAEDEQIDIDFLYRGKNLELKTSLIPDVDGSLERAILQRDIKLIVRGATKIEDLRGDLHLQIMFAQKRRAKDEWLSQQTIDLKSTDAQYLYTVLGARKYKNTIYFVGWIDKKKLISLISNMPENSRTWSFLKSDRNFWNCKIRASNPPTQLIDYLKML